MSTSFFKPATIAMLDDLQVFADRNSVEVIISQSPSHGTDIYAIPLIEDDEERLNYMDDIEMALDAEHIAAQCDLPEQEV